MKKKTRVVVTGAAGRMGRETVKAIFAEDDLELVGAFDVACAGADAGELAGIGRIDVPVQDTLALVLKNETPDVVVDFTNSESFERIAFHVLKSGGRLVTGTTGIDPRVLKKLAKTSAEKKLGVIIAPNFAIGAVLMMQFAERAAKFIPDCEIIELHHNRKLDAPSGTAIATAEKIAAARKGMPPRIDPTKTVKVAGARGGSIDGVSLHSVRLPGFLAHQEVIFGAPGQSLTIRHDTISRECFMPGVVLCVRKIMTLNRMVVGLENLL